MSGGGVLKLPVELLMELASVLVHLENTVISVAVHNGGYFVGDMVERVFGDVLKSIFGRANAIVDASEGGGERFFILPASRRGKPVFVLLYLDHSPRFDVVENRYTVSGIALEFGKRGVPVEPLFEIT